MTERNKFLMFVYLGDEEDAVKGAVKRAYRDFQRVMGGIGSAENKRMKAAAQEYLTARLRVYFAQESFGAFDEWHRETADGLKKCFCGFPRFTYGCAQKWINMAFKYLYCLVDFAPQLGLRLPLEAFAECHLPIDRRTARCAKENGIEISFSAWSRLDDYDEYMRLQSAVREIGKAEGRSALDLDFQWW